MLGIGRRRSISAASQRPSRLFQAEKRLCLYSPPPPLHPRGCPGGGSLGDGGDPLPPMRAAPALLSLPAVRCRAGLRRQLGAVGASLAATPAALILPATA